MFRFLWIGVLSISFWSWSDDGDTPRLERGRMDNFAPETDGTGFVLFSTFDGRAFPAWTIPCQHFTDAVLNDFSVFAADDFVVPDTANAWIIERVEVFGTYFVGTGPADSINVYIFGHDDLNGLPDTRDTASAVFAAEELPYIDRGDGDFTVDLPGKGANLPPGRYWLCVQPNMVAGDGGQWGWTESSREPDTGLFYGLESAWWQSTKGLIPPNLCIDEWGARITDCQITDPNATTPLERDLAFSLEGEEVTNVTASPVDGLETGERGKTDTFQVVLAAAPTDDVTVTLRSGDPTEGALVSASDLSPVGAELMLVFTQNDWDTPRTVVVEGRNDAVLDGDQPYALVFDPAVSTDPDFSGIKPRDLQAVNREDACAFEAVAASPPNNATDPSLSGDGQILAFVSNGDLTGQNADGNTELFLYRRDTQALTQVTDTASGATAHPSVDGAGARIAFGATSSPTEGGAGPSEIFMYDVAGGTLQQITTSTGATTGSISPVVSADGSIIAFLSDANFTGENPDASMEAFTYNISTTVIAQISDDAGDDPTADVAFVDISGDGSMIVYTKQLAQQSLFLFDGGIPVEIDGGDTSFPSISNDGATIAFVSTTDHSGQNADGNGELFVFDPSIRGGAFTQITNTTGDDVSAVALSGNGSRIGFVTNADLLGENTDGNNETYYINLKFGTIIQASDTSGAAMYAPLSCSDDGFLLAYSLDSGTGFGLGIANLPDITVSYPRWPVDVTVSELLLGTCD